MDISLLIIIIFVIFFLASAIRILREYERAVIFRLGRLIDAKGPGLILLIPIVDKMVRVTLRTVALDVPPQDIITRDNVSVKVSAVIYFRVLDARKAVVEVEDYLFATSQMSQTTLRSILGQSELDELLAQREKINKELQTIIDTPHRTVGNQSVERRSEADRFARRYATCHGTAGRGGARETRKSHKRRRRISGIAETRRRRKNHRGISDRNSIEVFANPGRDRVGK